MQKGYYTHSAYVHLWVHILLSASHEEAEFMWNKKIEKLLPGQFLTGRRKLALATGIPETTIEDVLSMFEREGQIRQQKNNKFRLITVLNWKSYQDHPTTKRQQSDNKATTSRHIQEGKNERTISKDIETTSSLPKNLILLPNEPKTMSEQIDHSFPRKRLYGDEKINWLLDYTEYLLQRSLSGQERWNRIYARHMANKYGMGKSKEFLEKALSPSSWWFEKVGQFSTLYKNFDRIMAEEIKGVDRTEDQLKKLMNT